MIAVLLVVVGAGRPDHDQQHCYHHAPTVKPEAATAVVELLIMGVRTPETCWAVHKRQVINLRNICIQLVDLFEFPWTFFLPHTFYVLPNISWLILHTHPAARRYIIHRVTRKNVLETTGRISHFFRHFEKCVYKLTCLILSSSNSTISRSTFLFSVALLFIYNSLPVENKTEESQNVTAVSYIISA